MALLQQEPGAEAHFVQVCPTERNGTVFDHRRVAASAGPKVAVPGSCVAAQQVSDRLIRSPTLPRRRGPRVLLRRDARGGRCGEIDALEPPGAIDRTITPPMARRDVPTEARLRRSCHAALRVCADLGMNTGRGAARSGWPAAAPLVETHRLPQRKEQR